MMKKVRNPRRAQQLARRRRVAKRVNRSSRPRLTVFRSARHIYAQIVDPETGKTLGSVSTRSAEVRGAGGEGKVGAARKVGEAIAAIARSKEIEEVVFHRNGFQYHGRVKALAEAAREAGLRF